MARKMRRFEDVDDPALVDLARRASKNERAHVLAGPAVMHGCTCAVAMVVAPLSQREATRARDESDLGVEYSVWAASREVALNELRLRLEAVLHRTVKPRV